MANFRTGVGNIQDEPEVSHSTRNEGSVLRNKQTKNNNAAGGMSKKHRSQPKEPSWPKLEEFEQQNSSGL